jgi:hypothetical protein
MLRRCMYVLNCLRRVKDRKELVLVRLEKGNNSRAGILSLRLRFRIKENCCSRAVVDKVAYRRTLIPIGSPHLEFCLRAVEPQLPIHHPA